MAERNTFLTGCLGDRVSNPPLKLTDLAVTSLAYNSPEMGAASGRTNGPEEAALTCGQGRASQPAA